jgi:hypothetical protein
MITLSRVILSASIAFAFPAAQATVYNGIDFPQGAASFADSVVSFVPGSGAAAAFQEPMNALNAPDVNTTNGLACFQAPSTANCLFTSLGNGGVLTLRFTNNVLTGSSVNGVADGINDLYFWEVGVSEATTLDISKDGINWTNVGGIVGGSGSGIGVFTYGFDIDKLGFNYTDQFTYVRISDVVNGDPETSPAGADIDAVGAIQTTVPVPGAAWLLVSAGAMLSGRVRRLR